MESLVTWLSSFNQNICLKNGYCSLSIDSYTWYMNKLQLLWVGVAKYLSQGVFELDHCIAWPYPIDFKSSFYLFYIQNPGCRNWHYPILLPSVSVVLVFHNEALSVLLRTVVSIITRSPPHILTEVLLVDDFSDLQKHSKLKNELESWVSNQEKVRLWR